MRLHLPVRYSALRGGGNSAASRGSPSFLDGGCDLLRESGRAAGGRRSRWRGSFSEKEGGEGESFEWEGLRPSCGTITSPHRREKVALRLGSIGGGYLFIAQAHARIHIRQRRERGENDLTNHLLSLAEEDAFIASNSISPQRGWR